MDFEAAWCPVCSRLIEPKRYQVPIPPPQPPTPAPPPSSPQSSPTRKDNNNARRKLAARTRGGLVQGTGRMKPNGTIRRVDSASTKPQQVPLQSSKPAPIKYRTVIDQGPLPLYCSDECKRQDDKASSGSYSTESSGSSSTPSESSISTVSSAPCEQQQHQPHISPEDKPQYSSPSVAVIAKIYNFPPPPPPAPISFEDAMVSDSYYVPPCENGIIMAGRYIQERCAKPAKPQTGRHRAPPEPIKPVPGWNDGTNTWRTCVYSMSSAPAAPQVKHKRAFGSFVSSRSHFGDASIPLPSDSSSSVPSNAAMINKYADSLKSRATSPSSSDATISRRERSILPPGFEGKLLVPDVKLKVRTGSSTSLGSRVRSPLSATSESGDDESTRCDSPKSPTQPPKRPVPETRSWSYDKFKTYDTMPFPTKKEKRTQVKIVDGKEINVEVEVEVQQPIKRLFLFPASIQATS